MTAAPCVGMLGEATTPPTYPPAPQPEIPDPVPADPPELPVRPGPTHPVPLEPDPGPLPERTPHPGDPEGPGFRPECTPPGSDTVPLRMPF
jgi:hypothetical protein